MRDFNSSLRLPPLGEESFEAQGAPAGSFAYCALLCSAISGGQRASTPLATAFATSWIPTAAFELALCGVVFSLARAVLNGRGANVGAIYVLLAVGSAIALAVKPSGMSGEAFDFYGLATGAGVGRAIGGVYCRSPVVSPR